VFTAPEAYDRFMGRYSAPLAPLLADFAGVTEGQRVLDVGCGPGALTAELVARVGAGAVSAVDPSEPFVAAARARYPGADVHQGSAEALPFADAGFDASLAQLVVHFMASPDDGLREMRRVTRAGGIVAACVWDLTEGGGPLGHFWAAARELDPGVDDESQRAGGSPGHLAELLARAGLQTVTETALTVEVAEAGFDEWWEPFTLGVGPAGTYLQTLDAERRERLRERCAERFPPGPLVVSARAWAARGVV
jgi:ubiquinone/menaquinone biosynthesis C-methylase UbiE